MHSARRGCLGGATVPISSHCRTHTHSTLDSHQPDMPDRNWDSEMKKIDRQLESVSDRALLPTPKDATPEQRAALAKQQEGTSTAGVLIRLMLAIALGVGILFWPYAARCGPGLAAYLFAVGGVVLGGSWSAVWSWRHRSGRAHLLSLLLVLWGFVLAGMEVLPRVGYAVPTADHPAIWACE